MLVRQFVALGFLAFFLSALAIVPSCSDVVCQANGEGCPCEEAYTCGELPSCHSWMCDGTCHLWENTPGDQCLLDRRTCLESGACDIGICSGELQCVECVDDARCGPGHTCEAGGVCSRCDDGVKNGDETGVDCGGSCPLCPGTCNADGDCPDGYCWEGLCVSCHDGIKNGDETGVDCSGWGHCGYCLGINCLGEGDAVCASHVCDNGRCCVEVCPTCYYCGIAGECVAMPSGLPTDYPFEPERNCDGNFACDGQGKCLLDWGQPCTHDDECYTYKCVNGKCDD